MYKESGKQVLKKTQHFKETRKIAEDKVKYFESSLLFQTQQIAELKIVTASKDSKIMEHESQLEILEVLERSITVKDKDIKENIKFFVQFP